jgi:hypothetical protein
MRTFTAKCEDCDVVKGDFVDGFASISSTEHEWEITRVHAYMGRNGFILAGVDFPFSQTIIDWLRARPSWVEMVDAKHAAEFEKPAVFKDRLLVREPL